MVPSCVVISCCVEEPGFFVVEELELLPPVPGFEGFVGSEGSMVGFLSDITLIIATGEKLSNVKYQFPSLSLSHSRIFLPAPYGTGLFRHDNALPDISLTFLSEYHFLLHRRYTPAAISTTAPANRKYFSV